MTKRLVSFAGWALIIAVSLYFIYNNALHYFLYKPDEFGTGYWPTYAPFLMVHIIAGMTALLLGPFQFIPAIRKNYPTVHRTTGKIYLISVLVAATASLILSLNKIIGTEKALVYGMGLAGLGFAWLITSSMAYWSVRRRSFQQHREWMVRSFVVTTAFASFRLIDKILVEQFHMDPASTGTLMSWACWAFPLFIAEVFIQGNKIRKGSPEPIPR